MRPICCRPCLALKGFPVCQVSGQSMLFKTGPVWQAKPYMWYYKNSMCLYFDLVQFLFTLGLFQNVHALVGPARWLRAWEAPSSFPWNIEPGWRGRRRPGGTETGCWRGRGRWWPRCGATSRPLLHRLNTTWFQYHLNSTLVVPHIQHSSH